LGKNKDENKHVKKINTMKSNILFLVIDSFRTDKFLGKNKSSLTPNLDHLISKGVFFEQMISSSDQTGTSIASIFTGLFPCRKNLNEFTFTKNEETFLSELKNQGYETYSFLPDIDFFKELSKQIDFPKSYNFLEKNEWKKICEGLGNDFIKKIPKSSNPWFYYFHIMDIRNPYNVPEKYVGEEFGKSDYDKIVSSLDDFFGELIKEIDLTNTLIVISSDHGEYIPATKKFNKKPSKLEKVISEKTKSKSFIDKIGKKAIMNLRFASQTYQKEKLKHELTPYQLRSLNSRAQIDLYDELIRIPFLIVGQKIPKKYIIKNLVRQVDIFPTLLDLIEINTEKDVDGKSMKDLINGKKRHGDEIAYIQVGINAGQLIDDKSFLPEVVGIRTENYKYYRYRENKNKFVNLYNLKKDPLEENNLSKDDSEHIIEFEKKLSTLLDNKKENKLSVKSKEDAIELLKKLGYV
jgi:arylsulfatase